MKVRMKTLMAGPGGIRHLDEVVDLPKAEANALIKAAAAVPVPSASTHDEGGVISDKDPFTDEDWSVGVIICRWLRAEAPEDCQEADRSWVPMSGTPELSAFRKHYRSAAERLHRRLRQALHSGEYELRAPEPRNDPFAKWKPLPPYQVREVLDQYRYRPKSLFDEFRLKGCDGRVPVRVFRRHRQEEHPAGDIGCGAETEEIKYADMLLTQPFQTVVFTVAEDLKRKCDKGGRGFPRRIHKRMGSPVKPSVETVRRYLSDRRRGLR